MTALTIPNTFVDGNVIFASGPNTNNDAIKNYINDRNSGASAWERVLATNASSVPAVFNNGAGTNDSLDCQDNGTIVFRVADAGNVVVGSAALLTTATDGFLYTTSCPGLPTGVATSFTGRVPLVVDSSNNRLYFYNSGWQNVANNPAVDNSTIELNSNQLRIKDGLTIQTVNVGTALKYQTFASLPILQIQSYTTTTSGNTSSTSFTNTNLTGSFTPKLATSKVLIFVSSTVSQNVGDGGYFTIARGGTNLAANTGGFFGTVSGNNYDMCIFTYDSPATASAITYSVQYRTAGGGATIVMPVTLGGVVPQATMIIAEVAQ